MVPLGRTRTAPRIGSSSMRDAWYSRTGLAALIPAPWSLYPSCLSNVTGCVRDARPLVGSSHHVPEHDDRVGDERDPGDREQDRARLQQAGAADVDDRVREA